MEKLLHGIHKFQSDIFHARKDLFSRLIGGQKPQALFITCSDSRVVPELVTQADPGDLFVLRNAGNLIPPYAPGASGEAATIEYAVRGLGVRDIIVCGHTRCGAMQACLEADATNGMPRVRSWLTHADASVEIVVTQYPGLAGEARWKVLIQENVLVQIENLRTHPSVAAALARNELRIHAWVYKMETGQVFSYDPATGQYTPLVLADGTVSQAPLSRHHDDATRRAAAGLNPAV